jgi:voltage-gated potassium channel Kch
MNTPPVTEPGNEPGGQTLSVNWRWFVALLLYGAGLAGMLLGVGLSERPEAADAGVLTKAYYSLGLFVVGGLDLGTPVGGPLIGRVLLWLAYFGCPLLMASAVIEAVLRVMHPGRWQLRMLADHIVIVGAGELTTSYLRILQTAVAAGTISKTDIVVIDDAIDPIREDELTQTFGVKTLSGDITHRFIRKELKLRKARQLVFLGENDFRAYEAAAKALAAYPTLASRIVIHCQNLRFMRAMQDTAVAKHCIAFNSYHLAAQGMVRHALIEQFHETAQRDVIIIAGFGRFGQTVMEELDTIADAEIETMYVLDIDANRRLLVAEEQLRIRGNYERVVLQGDIAHPDVWRKLTDLEDLNAKQPTILLGTGSAEDNLRTALWLKRKYPNAVVFARTNDISRLALDVGAEHDIGTFSITQLVEDNVPQEWLPISIRG